MNAEVAEIQTNKISILSNYVLDGESWIEISVPNGWDDVKKLCKKVLRFGGRDHGFSAWNSDKNVAYFRSNAKIAEII